MTEETFVHELERRADDVRAVPLSFEDIRGRAHHIRRRRRTAVAAGVAAAVALVIVVPTVLTGSGGPKSEAPDPAPPLPTAPGASVLHDGVLTLPDGETVDLDVDNADVTQLGVLADGRIVVAMTEPFVIRVYAADGTVAAEYGTQSNTITMSADDTAAAWLGQDFRSRVLASGVAEPTVMDGVPMPGEASGSIDAVLAPDRLLVGDWNTTGYLNTPGERRELTTSEPLRVTDVSPDGSLWAVQYVDDADPQFGCSGLYDPAAAEMVARSCETAGLRFAPDGRHLLGMRGDNNMYGDAATYDLELREVGRFTSDGRGHVISRAAWADPNHLLVAETDWRTNAWSLVRVSLDWSEAEDVVPEQPGRSPELIREFIFSE